MHYLQYKSHLESDFDSLISGASDDIKKACLKELSSLEKELETVCTDEHDEDLVVADYNSDAEEAGDGKEDEDNEEEHITKVSVEFTESKQIVNLNFSRLCFILNFSVL